MSCSKEEYERLYGNNKASIEELEAALRNATTEPTPRPKPEPAPYEIIKTKVWKKRFAPIGKLFFGVRVKRGANIYTSVIMLDVKNREDHLEKLLYETMYAQIVTKYKL